MAARPRFNIDSVRQTVRLQVDKSSLRAVASEIGMSWRGLQYFLDGKDPRVLTGKKLIAWYRSRSARRSKRTSAADVKAAIGLLNEHIASAATDAGIKLRLEKIVAQLSEAARKARTDARASGE